MGDDKELQIVVYEMKGPHRYREFVAACMARDPPKDFEGAKKKLLECAREWKEDGRARGEGDEAEGDTA